MSKMKKIAKMQYYLFANRYFDFFANVLRIFSYKKKKKKMEAINEFKANVMSLSQVTSGNLSNIESFFLNFIKIDNVLDFINEIYGNRQERLVSQMFAIMLKLFIQYHWPEIPPQIQEILFEKLIQLISGKVEAYLQLNCCLSDITLFNPSLVQTYFENVQDPQIRLDFLKNIICDADKYFMTRYFSVEDIQNVCLHMLEIIFANFDNYQGADRYSLINDSIKLAPNLSFFVPLQDEIFGLSQSEETTDFLLPIIDSVFSIASSRMTEEDESFYHMIYHSSFVVSKTYFQQGQIDETLIYITKPIDFEAMFIFTPDYQEELSFIGEVFTAIIDNSLIGNENFRELIKIFIYVCTIPVQSEDMINFYLMILDITVLLASNGIPCYDFQFSFLMDLLGDQINQYFVDRLSAEIQPGHFFLASRFNIINRQILNHMVKFLLENPFYDRNMIDFVSEYGMVYSSYVSQFIQILANVPEELIYFSAEAIGKLINQLANARALINDELVNWLIKGLNDFTNLNSMNVVKVLIEIAVWNEKYQSELGEIVARYISQMLEYQIMNKLSTFDEFMSSITDSIFRMPNSLLNVKTFISQAVYSDLSSYVQLPDLFTQRAISVLFHEIGKYINIDQYREYLAFVLTNSPHPFHIDCFQNYPELLPFEPLTNYINTVEGEDKQYVYSKALMLFNSLPIRQRNDDVLQKMLSILSIDAILQLMQSNVESTISNALVCAQAVITMQNGFAEAFIESVSRLFASSISYRILVIATRIIIETCKIVGENRHVIINNIAQMCSGTPENIINPFLEIFNGPNEQTPSRLIHELILWRNENMKTNTEALLSHVKNQ